MTKIKGVYGTAKAVPVQSAPTASAGASPSRCPLRWTGRLGTGGNRSRHFGHLLHLARFRLADVDAQLGERVGGKQIELHPRLFVVGGSREHIGLSLRQGA